MDGSVALRRAVGSASDDYSLSSDEVATVSKDDCVEGRLPRGTICAAVPEQMAVPEEGSGKIASERHSSATRFFYEKAKGVYTPNLGGGSLGGVPQRQTV